MKMQEVYRYSSFEKINYLVGSPITYYIQILN